MEPGADASGPQEGGNDQAPKRTVPLDANPLRSLGTALDSWRERLAVNHEVFLAHHITRQLTAGKVQSNLDISMVRSPKSHT